MNVRKIFILCVVLFAVLGISLSAASAATTTLKINKNSGVGMKYIGSGNHRDVVESMTYDKKVEVHVLNVFSSDTPNHKITKAKIYFKNKKGKSITKTYEIPNKKRLVKKIPKGYAPYKVTVTYSKR